MLDLHHVEALLDAPVSPLSSLLEVEAVLHPLDGAGDRGRYSLDAALHGGLEHGDVALPSGRPLESLTGETLLGSGHHEVERGKCGEAASAHAKDLGPAGSGDANGHVGCCVCCW